MRSGSALLLVLLLGSLQLSSSAPDGTSIGDCCPKITQMKIPLKQIVSFTETPSHCALKAIVILTKKGIHYCVDPESKLVRNQVAALDRRNKTTTAKPATTNSTTLSTTKLLQV